MHSFYSNTPYNLNIKLHSLHKNPLRKNADVNILYKNISNSIPELTNQFFFLKNRTKTLNISLNKIPIISNNLNINSHSNTTKTTYSSYLRNLKMKASPNLINYNYTSALTSPKPALKPYMADNHNRQYSNLLSSNKYKYKLLENNLNNDGRMKLNYNFTYGKSANNNPIKKFSQINNNKNHSSINMIRGKYRYNKMRNFGLGLDIEYNDINKINNKSLVNKINRIKNPYREEIKKLNKKLAEKDNIIHKMRGVIKDTFYKLNRKKEENSLLQSEILELKSRKNYDIDKGNNKAAITGKKNYNKILFSGDNSKTNEKIKKNKYRRKKHLVNNINNRYKTYNRNAYNKTYYNIDFDTKWEEIHKLNKKMDNLLHKNENKLRIYEKMCKIKK